MTPAIEREMIRDQARKVKHNLDSEIPWEGLDIKQLHRLLDLCIAEPSMDQTEAEKKAEADRAQLERIRESGAKVLFFCHTISVHGDGQWRDIMQLLNLSGGWNPDEEKKDATPEKEQPTGLSRTLPSSVSQGWMQQIPNTGERK